MKIGDKVLVKNEKYIEPLARGKEGEIVEIHDELARVKIDFGDRYDGYDGYLAIDVKDIEPIKEYQPKHAKEINPMAEIFCTMANIDKKVLVHRSVCNKLNDIYKQKNEKYGDSFGISVKKYGLISALTRISDKFNRFEQLILEGSNGTDDETLLDTCLDTANYFIMTAMELQERNK